jgi:hypothetical protein
MTPQCSLQIVLTRIFAASGMAMSGRCGPNLAGRAANRLDLV